MTCTKNMNLDAIFEFKRHCVSLLHIGFPHRRFRCLLDATKPLISSPSISHNDVPKAHKINDANRLDIPKG